MIINYVGNIEILNKPSVGIIGSKKPTDFGYILAIHFAERFAEYGFNIISGLSQGCDTAGHIGALNKKGFTTAILTDGLNKINLYKNKELVQKIVEEDGLLISQYFIENKSQSNFIEKNITQTIIQNELSLGVFVPETSVNGETMKKIEIAEKAKKIIAVLKHPKSEGNKQLIRAKRGLPIGDPDHIQYHKEELLKKEKNPKYIFRIAFKKPTINAFGQYNIKF